MCYLCFYAFVEPKKTTLSIGCDKNIIYYKGYFSIVSHESLKKLGSRTGGTMRKQKYYSSGVTLIELVIGLAVVAILAAIALGSFEEYWDRADITDAKTDIFSLDVKINNYYTLNKTFPESLDDIGGAMEDPWGNPYRYTNIELDGVGKARKDHNLVPINSDYDLHSMGKDGESVSPLGAKASQDDIIRANDGTFIGLAEDY